MKLRKSLSAILALLLVLGAPMPAYAVETGAGSGQSVDVTVDEQVSGEQTSNDQAADDQSEKADDLVVDDSDVSDEKRDSVERLSEMEEDTENSALTGDDSESSDDVENQIQLLSATPFSLSPSGWNRVYGQDQLDTMQQISKTGWQQSDTVVIATDATYWDALAANSLAGALGCPVLLTKKGGLSSQTAAEIKRLGAKKAYVCGGPIAIASAVDDQIKGLGCEVQRVYGQDQQDTSLEIAKLVLQLKPGTSFIVATSYTFQDALSIAPYSYAKTVPVLICDSGSNALRSSITSFIKEKGLKTGIVVGGPIAVSSSVDGQLSSAGASAERVYGQTEYETSVAIANWELDHGMGLTAPGLATGTTFYDALTGAGLCGLNNSVLVIASSYNRVALTDFVSNHRSQMTGGYVFGGPIAISDSVKNTLDYCFKNGYSSDYATDEEKPYSAVYNYEYYKANNSDVAKAYGNDRSATLNHFLSTGMAERRQAIAGFSVRSYYNQYVDLRNVFGTNWKAYYQHYISNGKSEGRAGTGCNSLVGGWQYHNVPWAGQPNNYYCGPTSGYMILSKLGAWNSAADGRGLSIWNLAQYMDADSYGGTSFHNRSFQNGMNRWLGKSAYTSIHTPSYSQARDGVLRSFETGYPAAVDAQERRGGPHLNGHNNSTFIHIMVVDAYNQDTDQVVLADPGAVTVWSGSSKKFTYSSLKTLIETFCQHEIYSDGRQRIGIYVPA